MQKCTINLFGDTKTPNRRLTPRELETEYELCSVFKRHPRYFLHDLPFYPYVPQNPNKVMVNFDLNYP